MYIKILFQIAKRDTRHIVGQYNGSIDACKFLRDGRNPLANHIYQTFKPYSNINHTCPYNVSITLYLKKHILRLILAFI